MAEFVQVVLFFSCIIYILYSCRGKTNKKKNPEPLVWESHLLQPIWQQKGCMKTWREVWNGQILLFKYRRYILQTNWILHRWLLAKTYDGPFKPASTTHQTWSKVQVVTITKSELRCWKEKRTTRFSYSQGLRKVFNDCNSACFCHAAMSHN